MQSIPTDEIKLTDLVRGFKKYSWHVLKWSWVLVLFCVLFGWLGYWFAKKSPWAPPDYVANASFNAVDAKSSAGGLMALAGSFGVNIGGGGTSNEVLMGIFKSRKVIKSALLTDVDYNGKKEKLGNIYLDISGLTEDFQEIPLLKDFRFKSNNLTSITPAEDSLLAFIYNGLIEDYILVEYDPLAGLIKASVETRDFILSQQLCAKALQYTVEYYTLAQGDKNKSNFNLLNRKVDSLGFEIKRREDALAGNKDRNVFNKKQEESIIQQKYQREISILTGQYSEAVNSRETARTSMLTTSNIMNIVDNPMFSVDRIYLKTLLWVVIGVLVGFTLGLLVLILQKAIKEGFEEEKQLQQ